MERADIDECISGLLNGAPILYMFFKSGKFDVAEVAADNCILHLQAGDVVRGVMAYIGVYSVFHVGYASQHAQFLAFLAHAFLGVDEKVGKESLGLINLKHAFDEKLAEMIKKKSYKKLCVNVN